MSINKLLILPLPILSDLHSKPPRLLKAESGKFQKSHLVSSHDEMLFLETEPVKLHGRSRPARKICEDGLPYGSWTLWVSKVEGVQGFLVRFMLKKVSNVKGFKKFKGPRASGTQGIKGFKAYRKTSLVYLQGIKGTVFSLSVLDYAKRYCACT